MLIAEFCQRSDLTRDAVRLYVRLGLIRPEVDAGNRYQRFTPADVERVAVIRMAQQLGFTLKQIVVLNREYEAGAMDTGRKLAVMRQQLQAVEAQAARMQEARKGRGAGSRRAGRGADVLRHARARGEHARRTSRTPTRGEHDEGMTHVRADSNRLGRKCPTGSGFSRRCALDHPWRSAGDHALEDAEKRM